MDIKVVVIYIKKIIIKIKIKHFLDEYKYVWVDKSE